MTIKFRLPRHRGSSISHIEKTQQALRWEQGIEAGNLEFNRKSLQAKMDMATRGTYVRTVVMSNMRKELIRMH